jgi:hypothetical protein
MLILVGFNGKNEQNQNLSTEEVITERAHLVDASILAGNGQVRDPSQLF